MLAFSSERFLLDFFYFSLVSLLLRVSPELPTSPSSTYPYYQKITPVRVPEGVKYEKNALFCEVNHAILLVSCTASCAPPLGRLRWNRKESLRYLFLLAPENAKLNERDRAGVRWIGNVDPW